MIIIFKFYVCPRGHFSLSSDAVSTGFVPDGSSCGTNLACLNRQCVSSSSLTTFTCPAGSNGQRCSGNGVSFFLGYLLVKLVHEIVQSLLRLIHLLQQCNNNGGCSCNTGFSGTTCQNTGGKFTAAHYLNKRYSFPLL